MFCSDRGTTNPRVRQVAPEKDRVKLRPRETDISVCFRTPTQNRQECLSHLKNRARRPVVPLDLATFILGLRWPE